MLLAVRGIEGKSGVLPSNGWVMFVEPWFAKDDVMGDVGNIQADWFFIPTGLEDDVVKMGDGALLRAFTVRKD